MGTTSLFECGLNAQRRSHAGKSSLIDIRVADKKRGALRPLSFIATLCFPSMAGYSHTRFCP